MGYRENTVSRKPDAEDQESEPLHHFPNPLDQDFRKSHFEVATLRNRLRLSQTEFAHRFGIPVATLRHWESGKRKPSGPSLSLLQVIAYHPGVAMRAITRARRAWEEKPPPRTYESTLPALKGIPQAYDDDVEP